MLSHFGLGFAFMSEYVAFVIKTVRKNNTLTQAKLAEDLGVSPSYIGTLEQGRGKPSFELMEKIIAFYNIDANLFFGKSQKDSRSIDENTIKHFQNLLSNVSEQIGDYGRSVEEMFSENIESDE